MSKILATSDLHGHLPEIEPCDILIIAGDVCPVRGSHAPLHQAQWCREKFAPWLESLPAKHIIGIGGNHDFVFEQFPEVGYELPWTYLDRGYATIEDITFYGFPYVPTLKGWAFYKPDYMLEAMWAGVEPLKPIDILITHSPPHGISDRVSVSHTGDWALRKNLKRLAPKVVICGHIHEGFGHYTPEDFPEVYNVAYLDRYYDPTHNIVKVDYAR